MPKEEGWIRNKFDVSNDMFFRNPIDRFIDESGHDKNYSKNNTVLLIESIFE